MNPLPDHLRQQAFRTAKHEAGHYIIARALGFRTGGIKVKVERNGGRSGGAFVHLNADLTDNANVLQYLRGRVLSLYGGVLSEALGIGTGVVDNEAALDFIKTSGATDHAKVREFVNMIRNIQHGDDLDEKNWQPQLDAIESELWNEASAMVTKEHKLIEGLGGRVASLVVQLNVDYELTEEEINTAPAIQERFFR